MTADPYASDAVSSPDPPWRALLEIALVFAVFFLHGAWPMPDDNETGYVVKAQHYWTPGAYKNDFFANTVDAHFVYYWSFGWLTTLGWSLTTVAWVGRIATWLMLAISWRGLSWAIIRRPWIAVLSAELFLFLCERGQMAGEWIAGSVEAKGFAWAFVLWALTALVYRRWNFAWLLAGIATSLHVVVGGWSAVCLAAVWISSREKRPSVVSMLPGIAGYILLAVPGVYPALIMNRGADWETLAEANRIQVFERLRHHLLPYSFSKGGITRQVLLWVVFFFSVAPFPRLTVILASADSLPPQSLCPSLDSFSQQSPCSPRFRRQLSPLLLDAHDRHRRSDRRHSPWYSVYPLPARSSRTLSRCIWIGLLTLATIDAGLQLRHLPGWPKSLGALPARTDKFDDLDAWIDACTWIADSGQIPADAVFLTPGSSRSFKWFTHHGEVVTWKDMPQDAKSIIEWWKRINEIDGTGSDDPDLRWRDSLAELGDKRLDELADKYGAQYAIVELLPDAPRLTRQPLYENKSFAVYHVGH